MGSVGQSGLHASACAEYTGQSDGISGGRVVVDCHKIVHSIEHRYEAVIAAIGCRN